MVKTIEEANRKSFDIVDGNLSQIQQEVDYLHNQLDDIREINTDGQYRSKRRKKMLSV